MKVEIKVPSMGESISEATVANIIKATGSQVAMDDEILELETDKVNQVLYAPQAGVITLSVKPEDKVKIGQVLGYVDTEGTATKETKKEEGQKTLQKQENRQEASQKEEKSLETTSSEEKIFSTSEESKQSSSISARYNKEAFLKDLQPQSTEEKLSKPEPVIQKVAKTPGIPGQRESRRKMSNIRKIIASRMVEVKNTTAMLTTFNEVDMSQIVDLREKYKDAFIKKYDVKLGLMSFFVKACVSALQQFPDINSYIDGDEIVHREFYDIGMAVGTDRGVIVPIIRDCERLSFSEIEIAIEQFAKKAREGTITIDDLQGGSFTITNGGIYGSMLSTPIITPNQSAILGLHKITKRPVVVDDQIVIRPIMYLALSYDHRIVDGKEAVSFLVHMKNILENPGALLLDL